jgi:HNH endonuclease
MTGNKGRFVKGQHWRSPKPFWERSYLVREYAEKGRSAADIAAEHGCTEANILFWLKKHEIPRRTIAQARLIKHWGSSGPSNPMFGKRGKEAPNWKGGVTPERQRFYSSLEWQAVVIVVFERDEGRCRRCGILPHGHRAIHIHHIIPFEVAEFRADPRNLVLLCPKCHGFVRSRKNVDHEFVAKGGDELEQINSACGGRPTAIARSGRSERALCGD